MTVINSNISALKAQATIAQNERKLNSAMERLSTGTRINSAKDDAAGLAISTKMTSQINGLNQAIRNANDGLSMVSTIEASLSQTTNVLQRMRELAVQSASDSNGVEDRQFLQAEIVQMNSELDRVAIQSRYNGLQVLDGSFTNKQLQIGANGNETIAFNIAAADSASLGVFQSRQGGSIGAAAVAAAIPANNGNTASTFTIAGNIGTTTASIAANSNARDAAAQINGQSSNTGVSATAVTKVMLSSATAGANTFTVTGKNSTAVSISANVTAATDLSAIADAFNLVSAQTGITAQLSSNKANVLLTQGDGYNVGLTSSAVISITGMIATATADSLPATATNRNGSTVTTAAGTTATLVTGDITLNSNKAFTVTSTAASFIAAGSVSGSLSAMSTISVATQSGASQAIAVIDGAIGKVSSMRGDLGAIASRLEKTVDALTAASTNTAAARSRILDADYSTETTNLSKSQIISQASNAMLAQANQQPQLVLALLK